MKRLLTIALTLFVAFCALAQGKYDRIIFKDGTIYDVTIIRNTDDVVECKYPGEDLITVFNKQKIAKILFKSGRVEMLVEEPEPEINDNLPDTYVIQVGPYEMLLVRGGRFNMGYDGRGSKKYNSEPVHPVIVSDYYVTKNALSKDVVKYLKRGGVSSKASDNPYVTGNWTDATKVVSKLANESKLPFSLISEAQWEYLIHSGARGKLVVAKGEKDLCLDIYGDFEESDEIPVDPTGPVKGHGHVLRPLDEADNDVFARICEIQGSFFPLIRATFPASVLLDGNPLDRYHNPR